MGEKRSSKKKDSKALKTVPKDQAVTTYREPTQQEFRRIELARAAGEPLDYFKAVEGSESWSPFFGVGLSPEVNKDEIKGRLMESTGLSNYRLAVHIAFDVAQTMGYDTSDIDEYTERAVNEILHKVASYAPTDAIESTLVRRIIILESEANRCMRLAERQDMLCHASHYANLANKLEIRLNAALESLSRHRRGGKQTVEVTHLHQHNHAGAQGIVAKELHGAG